MIKAGIDKTSERIAKRAPNPADLITLIIKPITMLRCNGLVAKKVR